MKSLMGIAAALTIALTGCSAEAAAPAAVTTTATETVTATPATVTTTVTAGPDENAATCKTVRNALSGTDLLGLLESPGSRSNGVRLVTAMQQYTPVQAGSADASIGDLVGAFNNELGKVTIETMVKDGDALWSRLDAAYGALKTGCAADNAWS